MSGTAEDKVVKKAIDILGDSPNIARHGLTFTEWETLERALKNEEYANAVGSAILINKSSFEGRVGDSRKATSSLVELFNKICPDRKSVPVVHKDGEGINFSRLFETRAAGELTKIQR